MELRQLKHFLTVGEAGSISGAARRLRMTQPALSRQIKALEQELDTLLLERGAHSITLTPAGEVLLQESRKLLRLADTLQEKVKAAAAGEPLRVGYSPSLAGSFLSRAIGSFTRTHPRVRVSLHDCSSAEMRLGLAEGRLDLILAAPCEGLSEPIQWIPLCDYGWEVAMPHDHPLAAHSLITTRHLHGQRLLLFDRHHYPDYWDSITGFFRQHDLQAKIAGEFDGVSSLTAALEGRLGIALLAKISHLPHATRGGLVTRPLDHQPSRIEVAAGLSRSQPIPAHLAAFLEELKSAARESREP